MLNKACVLILLLLFTVVILHSEESVIYVEGENAVVTNFAKEPIFNFSCSNLLTLQLNKREESNSVLKYFADYIIDVPVDGTYELWIAGTPPGNSSSRQQSYFSPYEIHVDDEKPFDVYFEDVEVKEKYASGYYWIKSTRLNLKAGPHTIKIVINSRRNYDNLYFFYLDAFFLIRQNQQKEYIFPDKLPDFFPKNILDKKKITFKTPEDYLNLLKEDPDNVELLDMLSEIYTLTYQYNESIKYLKTASLIRPYDLGIKRLIAQNYLWKGDFNSGIAVYNSILKEDPKNLTLYKEIAKITSWFGIYSEALKIYENAISSFPDDLELKINYAITNYWDNKSDSANEILKTIELKGQKDPEILVSAGDILTKNRYYDLALQFYNYSINMKITNPRPYLESANIYRILGRYSEADETLKKLKGVYPDADAFGKIVLDYEKKNFLKDEFTKQLEEKMKNNPEDDETLILLAEVYAWQRNDKKAIDQYLKIIENRTFKAMEELESDTYPVTDILAFNNVCSNTVSSYYNEYRQTIVNMEKSVNDISKLQIGSDAYNAKLKELQGQSDRMDEIINIFGKITEILDANSLKINQKIQSVKTSNEAFNSQVRELKWSLNNAEYEKIYENNFKLYSGYLSLKILGLLYFYSDDARYRELFGRSYKSFPENSKTRFQYFQYISSSVKPDEVLTYLDANLFDMIPYNSDIQSVYNNIKTLSGNKSVNNLIVNESSVLVDKLINFKKQIEGLDSRARDDLSRINSMNNIIRAHLDAELSKKMFYFEKGISNLRLELGQYYSNIKEYDKALYEFSKVITVDRDNLDVKFLLAKNHQVRGNWFEAMNLYKEVFKNDPRNTLSASIYNQLADENPFSIKSTSKFYTEGNADKSGKFNTTLATANETIETGLYVNRYISFDITAKYDNLSYSNISIGKKSETPFSLFVRMNDFYFGNVFHFEILNTGIVISPNVGIDVFNIFQVDGTSSNFMRDQKTYINQSFCYPNFELEFQWKKYPYFNATVSYGLGIFKDSVIPGVDGFYFSNLKYLDASAYNTGYQVYLAKHNFTLDLNYNFKFTRIYPFTKISMSTRSVIDVYALSDIQALFDFSKSPVKYSINQDLYFNFAEVLKAGLNFYFIGLFIYEGSDKDFYGKYDYTSEQAERYFARMYTPHRNISGKWGFKLKFETGGFSKVPLSFSTQVLAGSSWQKYSGSDNESDIRSIRNSDIPYLLFNIDNTIELWLKSLTLVIEFNYSLSYDLNRDFNKIINLDNISNFQSFNGSVYIKVPIHQNLTY